MVARIVVVAVFVAAVAVFGRVNAQRDALELYPAAHVSNPVMRAYALSLRRHQENNGNSGNNGLMRNRRQKDAAAKTAANRVVLDEAAAEAEDVDSTLLEADRLYDEIVNELDALVNDLARQHEQQQQQQRRTAAAAAANSAQMPSWLHNLMLARRQL